MSIGWRRRGRIGKKIESGEGRRIGQERYIISGRLEHIANERGRSARVNDLLLVIGAISERNGGRRGRWNTDAVIRERVRAIRCWRRRDQWVQAREVLLDELVDFMWDAVLTVDSLFVYLCCIISSYNILISVI